MEDLFAANPRNLKLSTTGPALLPVCASDTILPLGRLRLQESQSKREKYQGALASLTQRTP